MVVEAGNFELQPFDVVTLSFFFTLITFTALLVFTRGRQKQSGRQTFSSLTAIGIKFLLEMILALGWFIIGKKTSTASVVLFFLLYLAFTIFLMTVILNSLKNKSL
jgi:hypothetical protein